MDVDRIGMLQGTQLGSPYTDAARRAEAQKAEAYRLQAGTQGIEPKEPPSMLLLNEARQLAEVCAQFASRLGNIEDRLIGGIPRVAGDPNKAEQAPRRCAGVFGEIEGAHQLAAVHLHRIKDTIERLEQNI